jgi:hypothetical protein
MWDDSEFQFAAAVGSLPDLCTIPAVSKMFRHRFPHLFFTF